MGGSTRVVPTGSPRKNSSPRKIDNEPKMCRRTSRAKLIAAMGGSMRLAAEGSPPKVGDEEPKNHRKTSRPKLAPLFSSGRLAVWARSKASTSTSTLMGLAGSSAEDPAAQAIADALEEMSMAGTGKAEPSSKAKHAGKGDAMAWTCEAWLSSSDVFSKCIAQAILQPMEDACSTCPDVPNPQLAFLRALASAASRQGTSTGVSAIELLLQKGHVVEKMAEAVWKMMQGLLHASATVEEHRSSQSKFLHEGSLRTLNFSGLDTYYKGLEAVVGPPNPRVLGAIELEHCQADDSKREFTAPNYSVVTTPEIEFHFVVYAEDGLKRLGRDAYPSEARWHALGSQARKLVPLAKFEQPIAKRNAELAKLGQPGLEKPELVAARLYTGPMYFKYNNVLRQSPSGSEQQGERHDENLYTTTLHAINSAVVKLSKLTKVTKVYRGVAGVLPSSFLEQNEYLCRGGIEPGFMSTTVNREVALQYSHGAHGQPGFVFEIEQGMLNRGADIGWLSQYPFEQEVLFNPLSGLEVQRECIEGDQLLLTVRLSINLGSQTIEQVIGTRRKLLADMGQAMAMELRAELKGSGFARVGVRQLQSLLDKEVLSSKPEAYNDDRLFNEGVSKALNAKARVLEPAKRLEWMMQHMTQAELSEYAKPIVWLLDHVDPNVRETAVCAFTKLTPEAQSAVAPTVLRMLPSRDESSVPPNRNYRKNSHENRRSPYYATPTHESNYSKVIEVLGKLDGKSLAPLAEELLLMLYSTNADVRKAVLAALRRVNHEEEEALASIAPTVIEALRESRKVRDADTQDSLLEAVQILGCAALNSQTEAVISLLAHIDSDVRDAGLMLLHKMKVPAAEKWKMVSLLHSFRNSDDVGIRKMGVKALKHLGSTAQALKAEGYTAADLMAGGFGAELNSLGFTASDLLSAGYNVNELCTCGFSAQDLLEVGVKPFELKEGGFSAKQMTEAGFNATDLKSFNYDLQSVLATPLKLSDVREAGYSANEFRAANLSASELKEAGFAAIELRDGGFSLAELTQAKFTATELKEARYTAKELKDAGFPLSRLKRAFEYDALRAAGFSHADTI